MKRLLLTDPESLLKLGKNIKATRLLENDREKRKRFSSRKYGIRALSPERRSRESLHRLEPFKP
jgi:hypothetical protein